MQKNANSEAGVFNLRSSIMSSLCLISFFLALFAIAGPASPITEALPSLAPTTAAWSAVTPSNPTSAQTNSLLSVTCVTDSNCWAVGYYNDDDFASRTLIQHWDGVTWSIVGSPVGNPAYGFLYGVTCVSSSDCWAVGRSGFETLIEHWDGTAWEIVTAPSVTPGDNWLNDVACVSSSDCWAVGHVWKDGGFDAETLIEHWNGALWSIVPSQNGGAGNYSQLFAVACPATSVCWAVGYYEDNNAQTLIERWDGTSWTIVSSPNNQPSGLPNNNFLYDVSCTSVSDCWSVGNYYGIYTAGGTLVEHWDGISWTITPSPNSPLGTSHTSSLGRVTCISASDCWATGGYLIGFGPQTLIEHWDGQSWAVVSSPNTNEIDDNYIGGIACATESQCWAVGEYDVGIIRQTLVTRWDGISWKIVNSPNNDTQKIEAVTCNSASDCWVVGGFFHAGSGYDQLIIHHWNGATWQIAKEGESSRYDYLKAVTCASSSDCWAVGYSYNPFNGTGIYETLVEHWNGSSWSLVSSPNTNATQDNVLLGVACASSSQCWAVGYYINGSDVKQTLVEQWNGTSWSIVVSPNVTPITSNVLSGVTCASPSQCWAVGHFSDLTNSIDQMLIEQWNGTAWTMVASRNGVSTNSNRVSAITCTSASDCWVVGHYLSENGVQQTLIEHWDGNLWSVVSSPNSSVTENNALSSVTCASASRCWTIGYHTDGNGIQQTLIEQWNGTSWTIFASPSANASLGNFLNSVTCAAQLDCWAVGYYNNSDGVPTPLIEHYSVPPVELLGAVSRKTHGNPVFDVDLPNTANPGIECRSGGAHGDYTIVFTFANTLGSVGSASLTSGIGSVSSRSIDGNDAHNYIVNLTGVTNAQTITVSLTDVSDSAGNSSPAVAGSMSVLIGDTNGDGSVNSGDIAQTKSQSGHSVTGSNFREDLNTDGSINSGDIALVKSKSGTALP